MLIPRVTLAVLVLCLSRVSLGIAQTPPASTPTRTPTLSPPSTLTPTPFPTVVQISTLTSAAGPACVVGTGTSASCTEAALTACLPGGASAGRITFNCGGPATITVTSTKIISADTTIDGASQITINGGNRVGVFSVNAGVKFSVENLTIANGSTSFGAGIWSSGKLIVNNSTFYGNSASIGGGGLFNNDGGTLTVTNSTFFGNSAGIGAGAIGNGMSAGGTLAVTNSTFSGNRAGNIGGGIYSSGTLTITNSTFSGNSASSGGGIANYSGTITVINTIVANSTCSGVTTDSGHNLDNGTTCGFSTGNGSLNNTNPLLDPVGLANNGGPTQTIALLAGSPAINAGNQAVCTAPPANNLDQRGYVRPGTGAVNCSIGAFEANAVAPTTTPTPTITQTQGVTATPTPSRTPGTPPCPQYDLGSTLPVSVSGTTTGGSNSLGGATCGGGGSNAPEATYRWTAPTTGTYIIDTVGSAFDTVLYLRGGTCTGSQLGCDDDSGGLGATSRLSVSLTAGQVIVIVMDGYGAASGSYSLHIAQMPTPTPTSTPTKTPTFTATPTPVANIRQLTFNGPPSYRWAFNPRITDDGSMVVYDDGMNVRFATVDGHLAGALTNVTSGSCTQPYPSAHGDQVAMVCTANISGQNPDGNPEIVLLNGPSLTFITNSFSPSWSAAPSISADGQTVAFSWTSGGSSEIYRWHAGQIARITAPGENSIKPFISADGQRILYERGGRVYLYDDQTQQETPVTQSIAGTAQLTRNGQTAVFRAPTLVLGTGGGTTLQLYAQPLDGALQRLTSIVDGSSLSDFASNADGSRVAAVFENRSIGDGMLWTPSGPRILPGVPPDAVSLSFDAAGRKLAFLSTENLNNRNPYHYLQLYVADIPVDPGAPTPTPTRTTHVVPSPGPCTGDCNSSGQVTVDEVLTMVQLALGNSPAGGCSLGDANSDGRITVDEILLAVSKALNGCVVPGDSVEQGLTMLAIGDLHAANEQFCSAAASGTAGDRARLYCAVSRIFTKLLDDPQLQELLIGSGVTLVGDSHDVCNWHAIVPHLPRSGAPSMGQLLVGVRDHLLSELDAARLQLEGLPAAVNVLFDLGQLPACIAARLGAHAGEIDAGDVRALRAGLNLAHAAIDALGAYDFDFDLHALGDQTAQELLAADANLGTLTAVERLASARQYADAGLADAATAITSILGETDDQANDLIVITPADRSGAARTAQVLELVRQALWQQVVFSSDVGLSQPAHLDLSRLFAGQIPSLRPLLPAFNVNGQFDLAHFLDPTFSGMAPELTQAVITKFFLGDNCNYNIGAEVTQLDCNAAAAQWACRSVSTYGIPNPFIPGGPNYVVCFLRDCLCGWS